MSNPATLVAELTGLVAESALSRHDVKSKLAKALRVYRQVIVTKAGAEFCVHLVVGNYAGALMIVVTHAGMEISAKYLAEAGGLLARISKSGPSFTLQADFLKLPQDLPRLNIISVGDIGLDETEKQGDQILRACAKSAQLGQSADRTARVAATKLSKLIEDTDGALDSINFNLPFLGSIITKMRPAERLGVRRYYRGAKYSGSFVSDKREGFGVLSVPDFGTYSGTWRDDRPFGFGVWKIRGLGTFAGETPHPYPSSVVGLSRSADGKVFLGEHSGPPIIQCFEDAQLSGHELSPQGFGTRTEDGKLKRGLWEGQRLATDLPTRLDIREKVLAEVDSPYALVWKAQENFRIAEERLRLAIVHTDINMTLQNFRLGTNE